MSAAALAASLALLALVRVRRRLQQRAATATTTTTSVQATGQRTLAALEVLDAATLAQARAALEHIDAAFARYTTRELAIAFNGGKDCLIVLHLVFAHLSAHPRHALPRVVYFCKQDDFGEMVDFMHATARTFGFAVDELDGDYKTGLQRLADAGVKAVLMGQRRTDPHAPADVFAPTSPGWPALVRVNPILDLDYAGVWALLRGAGVKYCRLYDEGYTSLGSTASTSPHPDLKGLPAHALSGAMDERAGRRSS